MELDPEKAKIAAAGKIEAIEGSFKILALLQEQEELLREANNDGDKKSFYGVESKIK